MNIKKIKEKTGFWATIGGDKTKDKGIIIFNNGKKTIKIEKGMKEDDVLKKLGDSRKPTNKIKV